MDLQTAINTIPFQIRMSCDVGQASRRRACFDEDVLAKGRLPAVDGGIHHDPALMIDNKRRALEHVSACRVSFASFV